MDKTGSTRPILGKQLGISNDKVAKIWKLWGIKPFKQETFKFSTDPELEAKIRDVVGLYLDPPRRLRCCPSTKKARYKRWTGPRRSCR